MQWLQFARDDGPTLEELEANRTAKEERLRRAKEFDAEDARLQLQETAHRGPGDGGYAAAFEQRNILKDTSSAGQEIRGKESEEERRIREAAAEERPKASSWKPG